MENLNWLSFILAAIVPMVVGFIYYHKALFGNAWMKSIGKTEEELQKGNFGLIMGVSFLMSFLITFFMLNFCNQPGQEGVFDTFKHGAAHGTILTLFLVAPIIITKGLFEHSGFKNIFINAGYWLITLSLMGGILDAMNHWPNTI